ncbi:MAG TPA: diguanylate cyclase [Syntrophobacteria bacterium]|nr:diguanylate cyclase [Syntrophobacteria bacterium]
MDRASATRDELLAEVEALRLRLAGTEEVEARATRAEEALKALEERNRMLGNSAPLGILTVDLAGHITGINGRMLEVLPCSTLEEARSLNVFQVPCLLDSGVAEDFRRCLETKRSIVSDRLQADPAGERLYFRYHLSPITDGSGLCSGVMAFVEDITDLKLVGEALRESEERYRLLFRSAPTALLERDASGLKAYLDDLRASGVGDIREYLRLHPDEVAHCMSKVKTVDFNDSFMALFEGTSREELSEGFFQLNTEEFYRLALEIIPLVAEGNVSRERETILRTLKGNPRIVLTKALAISGYEDTLSRIVISLVDITERKEAEEGLRASEQRYRDLAIRDNLTGLYNTRHLYRSLGDHIGACERSGGCLSVIFMDLDRFKHVVDSYGHLNGSRAVQEVAATIQASLEEPAYAVAYAGDEFIVVLPGFGQSEARAKAEEIRSRILETVYLRDQGFAVRLKASFGIATFPDHAGDMTGLLAAADKALFGVKEKGRDAVGSYLLLAAD